MGMLWMMWIEALPTKLSYRTFSFLAFMKKIQNYITLQVVMYIMWRKIKISK